jgi:hypothetical protein
MGTGRKEENPFFYRVNCSGADQNPFSRIARGSSRDGNPEVVTQS